MKKRLYIFGVAGAIAVIIGLVGALILHGSNKVKYYSAVGDPAQIYANAVNMIESQSATLSVTKIRQIVTNGTLFTEQSQQEMTYDYYGTDKLTASTAETLSIGDHVISIAEVYYKGLVYVTIGEANFLGQSTAENYATRLTPAVLLDASLYSSIQGFNNGETYLIFFRQPSAVESWATEAGAEFMDAAGTVLLSHDGKILNSAYTATYAREDCTIHLSVSIAPTESKKTVTVPEDTATYSPITYWDGPRLLERATGYLLQSKTVSAFYKERVYCQAFGDERTRNVSLFMVGGNNWAAKVDTQVQLFNTSHTGDVTHHLHEELFVDGKYTIRADGDVVTENDQIDSKTMQAYCENQLVSTIMLPQHIFNATYADRYSTLRIEFAANEAFAQLVSANACQTLYQKPELLNEMSEDSSTDTLICYLELDKNTGLPLSSGVEYIGSYRIGGLPYQLTFRADQNYKVPCLQAINEIYNASDNTLYP